MKSKLTPKILSLENFHYIFPNEKKSPLNINSYFDFPVSTNNRISLNKNPKNNQAINFIKKSSLFSSVTSSLKSMTLNSKLYGSYIDFYTSTTTPKKPLKITSVDKNNLIKNKVIFPIKLQPLKMKDYNKEKILLSSDESNNFFLTNTKDYKFEKNSYEFKYNKTRIRFDRTKTDNSTIAAIDFEELCETNLFESKLLKKIGLKKIDMENCVEEKQNNFKVLFDYLKKTDELKDIFNEKNLHRNLSFSERTAIKKERMEFKLDIYSLCFKFILPSDTKNNNNIEKEIQKLYLPFNLMPLFYLLDFTTFKVFLSEIIIFNKNENCFEYIKENLLIKIVKKYFQYIYNSLKNNIEYMNKIIFNKKETIFSLIYDWIVTTHSLNEEDEEENVDNNIKKVITKNYRCYKLKISLPKIKFKVDNLNIRINKFLNKHIIANLLKNNFDKWEKFIFFDLFSIKRFKLITNLIMLNKYHKLTSKKINLYKKHKVGNKNYEFFLTQIGENHSIFYEFIPHVVLMVFGKQEKKFQKINLNLKESMNFVKFGQNWGMINTLFKCMFLDKMKNKIFFKFELLEDENNALYNTIIKENDKNNIYLKKLKLNCNDLSSESENIKKVMARNKSIREKEKDKIQIRYKDKMFQISLLNCSIHKIDITSTGLEEKYYIVPTNLLKNIFNIKDANKILNMDYTDISIIAKYIGENCQSILSARESNNISEEKKLVEEAQIENDIINFDKPKTGNVANNPKTFLRLNTFQMIQSESVLKKDEKVENTNNEEKVEKRYSNKYFFPRGIFVARSDKKRVSITNANELLQSRFNNINRDFIKRRTLNLQNNN